MNISLIFIITVIIIFLIGFTSCLSYKRYCQKNENNNLTYDASNVETLI